MLDVAETGSRVDKETYKARLPELRARLVEAQFALKGAKVPVLIQIGGADRIGCEAVIDLLNKWLDARYVDTQAFEEASEEEESQRPRFWRYWMGLPPKGRATIFYGGLTLDTIADRFFSRIDDDGFAVRLDHVVAFERGLIADGMLLVKIWLPPSAAAGTEAPSEGEANGLANRAAGLDCLQALRHHQPDR